MSTAAIGYGFVAQPAQPAPHLRLTKRGRAVITTLAATPLVIVALYFALNGGMANATLESAGGSFEYITVEAGQSMWQLASDLAPQADPREVIEQVVQLNGLESSDVYPGQQLAVPAEYLR